MCKSRITRHKRGITVRNRGITVDMKEISVNKRGIPVGKSRISVGKSRTTVRKGRTVRKRGGITVCKKGIKKDTMCKRRISGHNYRTTMCNSMPFFAPFLPDDVFSFVLKYCHYFYPTNILNNVARLFFISNL
jgi:hypothetical protein